MIEALGHDAQGEGLNLGLRFVLRGPVGKDAKQIGDLGDPTPVCFALELNLERQRSLRPAILAGFGWHTLRSAEHWS
jgi:hypothetical protein